MELKAAERIGYNKQPRLQTEYKRKTETGTSVDASGKKRFWTREAVVKGRLHREGLRTFDLKPALLMMIMMIVQTELIACGLKDTRGQVNTREM